MKDQSLIQFRDEELPKIRQEWLDIADKESFKRETSFALQHLEANPYLNKATTKSKLKAINNIALTGLTLNPVAKLAYLVPRNVKVNGSYELHCCLDPSYMGLVKLLTDAGSVKSINTQIVYDGDEVSMDIASGKLSHTPYWTLGKEQGNIKGVYSIATLADGGTQIEQMPKTDIDSIMERSESYKAFKSGKTKSCIWASDYGEMARKTVIKRIYKHLPKTEKAQYLEEAIKLDNENNGFRPIAGVALKTYADNLLDSSMVIEDKEVSSYRARINDAEYIDEVSEIIEDLQQRQPQKNPANMGQKELANHLKENIQ